MKLPRFKLRSLFLLVAIFAVAFWAYFILWPMWTIYREQCQFEASLKRLKVGIDTGAAFSIVKAGEHCTKTPIGPENYKGQPTHTINYLWSDANYCIRYVATSNPIWEQFHDYPYASPLVGIEVFKTSPRPSNYKPRSQLGPPIDYAIDFAYFIMGDRKANPGFKYELIYSDPPAKPDGGTK